jgi:hypothetical protein
MRRQTAPAQQQPHTWRELIVTRILEDSGTTEPAYGDLTPLATTSPELAHEIIVWLVGDLSFDLTELPETLVEVVSGWIVRKPVLLLPLTFDSAGSDGLDEIAGGDVWSTGLGLIARVVHAVVHRRVGGVATARESAVRLHEAALRAMLATQPDHTVTAALELLAVGTQEGLASVVRRVGPPRWPSTAHAEFIVNLSSRIGPGTVDPVAVWDMVEMPVTTAIAAGGVSPSGATAMHGALVAVTDASARTPFSTYVLETLTECAMATAMETSPDGFYA